MRAWLVAAVIAVPAIARADFTMQSSTTTHTGIRVEVWQDASIPAVLHMVTANLSAASIQLRATEPANRGITTSAYSTIESAAIAINGDSFSVAYQPTGLAMGSAIVWPNTSDNGTSAVFDFVRTATPTSGEYTLAEIVPTGLIVTPDTLPKGALGVISGRPMLVRSGQAETQFDCADPVTVACEPAPRSAVALSADKNTLYLVVVDGWQAGSLGVTAAQLATFFTQRGVDMAMALDGGSSSTLVIDGAVANTPSDGVERPVANHLAVQFEAVENGGLIGLVCSKTISPCKTPLDAVTITLDTGATVKTDSSGVYQFTNRTPRYTCVTATLTGYYPTERCVVVGEGPNATYDSIAMKPCPSGGCPPPDAAIADAAFEYPDAPPLLDSALGDASNHAGETHGGGGCCQVDGDRPDFALALLVAWFLVRRRGTTVPG